MKKIDNRKTNKELFKNTGIIAIGQLGTKIINFFLLPLYTALLSTEEYGLVDLLSTYATFITVLVGLQMSQGAFRFLVTCREDAKKTKTVTSTILIATVFVSAVYTILFFLVLPFIHIQCSWYILLYVISALFLRTASGIARGYGKNADYAIANFISASLIILFNVLFLVIFKLGVEAMLLAYIIGPLSGSTFLIFKTGILRNISIKYFNIKEFKSILHYSLPLVPNELSWSVIHASDRMIVNTFINVAANGLIAVASKFSVIYTTVFNIFNLSWTEQVVLHYKDEGGPEYINRMFDRMIAFFGSIAIGIIAVMPIAFRYLVNEKFSAAYNLIPIYMIAVFFNAIIGLISAIYLVENETKQVAVSTMVAASVNVIVDLLLIKFVGVYAAPISSLCGYAVISFWRLYDVNKRHCKIGMPWHRVAVLLLMLVLSTFSFYSANPIIHYSVFAMIAIIACLINYKFIISFKTIIVRKK